MVSHPEGGNVGDDFWVGRVDATIEDHERRLQAINGNIAAFTSEIAALRLVLGRLVWAGPVLLLLTNALTALVMFELSGQ